MGLFTVRIDVAPSYPMVEGRTATVETLVDTGATYTTIPGEVLAALAVPKVGRISVRLADGTLREKDYGGAWVRVDGRIVCVTVLFGLPGDIPVLGVTTLEPAALGVDPVARRLIPVQAIQA